MFWQVTTPVGDTVEGALKVLQLENSLCFWATLGVSIRSWYGQDRIHTVPFNTSYLLNGVFVEPDFSATRKNRSYLPVVGHSLGEL